MGDGKRAGGSSPKKVNGLKFRPVARFFQLRCSTGHRAHMLNGFITLNIGQKCPAVDTLRQWRSPNYCLKIFEYSLEHCDELNCEQIAINGFAGPRVSVVISDMPRKVTFLKFNLEFLCFYKYSAQPYHVANSKNHQKVDGAIQEIRMSNRKSLIIRFQPYATIF